MWTFSFPMGDNSIVWEYIAAIVQNKEGEYSLINMKTDREPQSVVPNHSVPSEYKLLGDVHTHPYAARYGALHNVAFSGADISGLRRFSNQKGAVRMVEAGGRLFALMITDTEKATAFYKDNDPDQLDLKFYYEFKKRLKEGISQRKPLQMRYEPSLERTTELASIEQRMTKR